MSIMPNKEQVAFIVRSFDPTHQIILDEMDSVISIDTPLMKLLSITLEQKSNNLFEPTLYDLLMQNVNNSVEFISVIRHNIHLMSPCFAAINSDISISTRLAIPCIYLYMIIPTLAENNIKVINFYNLIEVAKKFQKFFIEGFFSTTYLSENLRNNLKKRSIYFAYESLKPLACFAPLKQINSTSDTGIFLAEILKSFHGTSLQRDDKLYRMKLYKHDGYIERNKYKYSMQISEQLQEKIKELPLIPFNQLTQNIAVGL